MRKLAAIYAKVSSPKQKGTRIPVPAIINEVEYEMAQERLDRNKKMASRNTQKPSILQGLLTCGLCGKPYYKKQRARCYYCCSGRFNRGSCRNISVRQDELDDAVWSHMIELLKNPQLIQEEIEQRIQESPDSQRTNNQIQEIEKELVRLNKAKNKLLDAFQDGECMTLDDLKVRMKVIEQMKTSLEKELKSIQASALQAERQEVLKDSMGHFMQCLSKAHELGVEEKQKVLRLLIQDIIITEESIKIKHMIPFSSESRQ